MENLQLILGVDKEKSLFSVYSSKSNPEKLEVYFGLALLEKIENGKQSLHFKLLVARLYNMKYKLKNLVEAFNIDPKTIRKWGRALKSESLTEMEAVFSGYDARRKLTPEIKAYTSKRFREIYQENKYSYSSTIRKDIKEIFGEDVSGESLRRLFNEEKKKMTGKQDAPQNEKRDGICDSSKIPASKECDIRKYNPFFHSGKLHFFHHAGLLLLFRFITEITSGLPLEKITCQWIMTVLLGAANIEQSRRLDFTSLSGLFDIDFLISPRHQRAALKSGSTEQSRLALLKRNASFVNASESEWFFYDPHGIRYTGMLKLLKGWCGSAGKITKVHYQDFIHTSSGEPVFLKSYDNYYDLRERIEFTIAEFMQIFDDPPKNPLFVIDRGIFGHDALRRADRQGIGIITWEKGYKGDGWDEEEPICHFRLIRYRNNSNDTITSEFNCIRYPFEKIPGYDRIIVRAARENKENIEVSVLINRSEISTEKTVTAIFQRWLQEGDFMYETRHFGLNQITSYDYEDYRRLEENLIEKAVESNQYIVLKLQKKKLEWKLKNILLKKDKAAQKKRKLTKKTENDMLRLKDEILVIEEEMTTIEKECTKEQKLIEQNAQKLKTEPKLYMDIIKITARNIFWRLFGKFRSLYNNYRNDHAVLREITRAPGFIEFTNNELLVTLHPPIMLQPMEKDICAHYLTLMTGSTSSLRVKFRLKCGSAKNRAKKGIFICDCESQPSALKY